MTQTPFISVVSNVVPSCDLSVRVLCPQAIQHPNDERVQEGAWAAVVPLVGKLKKFYEFSLKLGMSFFFSFL